MGLLEAKGIWKRYGRVDALAGVDFRVDEREIVGLVGDNGAGKSTLIKILAGAIKPDAGEIYFGSQKVKLDPAKARHLGIQAVFQELGIVNSLDVVRNIFLGAELTNRLSFLSFDKMNQEATKAIKQIGIEIQLKKKVGDLSGGQRQSVALARAAYYKAKLMLMDEPTAALSITETSRILEMIRMLRDQGVSSVFVTHNVHLIHSIADRIVVLSLGRKTAEVKKDETNVEHLTDLITTKRPDLIEQTGLT